MVARPRGSGRVAHPALAVLGENSHSVFRERGDLLLARLPNAERFELRGATRVLQVENPSAMAEALAAFFSCNPLG